MNYSICHIFSIFLYDEGISPYLFFPTPSIFLLFWVLKPIWEVYQKCPQPSEVCCVGYIFGLHISHLIFHVHIFPWYRHFNHCISYWCVWIHFSTECLHISSYIHLLIFQKCWECTGAPFLFLLSPESRTLKVRVSPWQQCCATAVMYVVLSEVATLHHHSASFICLRHQIGW